MNVSTNTRFVAQSNNTLSSKFNNNFIYDTNS